ncbi:DNA ligase [Catenovulum maritimum]|uniref:DNA ligase n=1 Tax=Catenovulum maritimum TaxID=1513271 RepID=UPI00069EB8A5|nr:DNA ligase [Catenovulum maritimum]
MQPIPLIRVILCIFYTLFFTQSLAAPRDLMLAKNYHQDIKLNDYWISEKYDGIRAYWDGQFLWTRSGNQIPAPKYFTQNFPTQALDGELWAGRGNFQLVNSITRSTKDIENWRQLTFMVFDLPNHEGSFDQRLSQLKQLLPSQKGNGYIQLVKQFKLDTHTELQEYLTQYVNSGAEGLMLHLASSRYRGKRTNDLLKLKQFEDAEAKVISYIAGKGKYTGLIGAILVEMPSGKRFKIGSGFSDDERANPPPIGSIITYKFTGTTSSGLPRFATYLRIRSK